MKSELITYIDPKSPVSEMFKTLRTNIQFMNSDKKLRTLLITSTLPGEGKSWTSANLAVTFAQAGKKVLLIDADMRKGRQFSIFGVSPTPGLSNYLSGVIDGEEIGNDLQNFVQKTEIENLFIIPAGNVPPNPSELLVSEKMIELNAKVKDIFDLTIFDGTPSLIVTDAPILSRIADSTVIVTAHNETKIDNVSKVKKAIENFGGKVAGVVINKIPISAQKYENTYYYYGSTAPTVVNDKKKFFNFQGDNKKHYSQRWQNIEEMEEPKFDEHIKSEPREIQKEIEQQNMQSNEQSIQQENIQNLEEKQTQQQSIELSQSTQDVLNQINRYLDEEKSKLKNGDE